MDQLNELVEAVRALSDLDAKCTAIREHIDKVMKDVTATLTDVVGKLHDLEGRQISAEGKQKVNACRLADEIKKLRAELDAVKADSRGALLAPIAADCSSTLPIHEQPNNGASKTLNAHPEGKKCD